MPRKLKIWNGRDWFSQGHLYVCAYSQQDAMDLANQAYRKIRGLEDNMDIRVVSMSEIREYWSQNCWGTQMDGVVPERGVWWAKAMVGGFSDKPRRIV